MTKIEVLAELREVIQDTVQPYAWSTARLTRWLSMGQDQFCKDTGFFTDFTTYPITTTTGVATYSISQRIIEVFELWYAGVRLRHYRNDMLWTTTQTPGQPTAWQADQQTGMITLYPTPDAAYVIPVRCWRKSVAPLTTAVDLELRDDEHVLACVEYAAYKAYGDHDTERQDPVKATDHLNNYVRKTREGKRDFQKLSGGVVDFGSNPLYIV
jgi:hypothetical protein